jgi:hypothetical protein
MTKGGQALQRARPQGEVGCRRPVILGSMRCHLTLSHVCLRALSARWISFLAVEAAALYVHLASQSSGE